MTKFFYLFICIGTLLGCLQTNVEKVWLDELDLSNSDQVAGSAVANKSMWGTPLVIAGDTFERGVGMHASGLMRIKLHGGSKSFHALVGIDDSAPSDELARATAEFFVFANNQEIWRSGVMRAGDKARLVELDLKNVDDLTLYIDHAGDGIVGDRTNWVDAWFEVTGKKPYTWQPEPGEKIILTPKEPLYPLINPPYYMVPASETRYSLIYLLRESAP